MMQRKLLLPAFILMILAQIYVPAQMIWHRENVLKTGTEFRFKTAPIDPNDPFRGKYIRLYFAENSFKIKNENEFRFDEEIYVSFTTDTQGFAKIKSVSKEKPSDTPDYIKAKILGISEDSSEITVDYPFDRFYMEESKAQNAEIVYRKSQTDSAKPAYALVMIKNGTAVLRDVIIAGISVKETPPKP